MWTAAYRSELPTTTRGKEIPICLLKTRAGNAANHDDGYKQQVLKWFRTHKPEAIVTPTIPVVEWLTEEGYQVPKDVAVVCMSLHYEGITTGIIEASREIGCAAANFLVSMLQRGEYGIPSLPQRVLMEGTWYTAKPTGKPNLAALATA
jgi:DNA-binding LacI/PurR family transcriptional regulator